MSQSPSAGTVKKPPRERHTRARERERESADRNGTERNGTERGGTERDPAGVARTRTRTYIHTALRARWGTFRRRRRRLRPRVNPGCERARAPFLSSRALTAPRRGRQSRVARPRRTPLRSLHPRSSAGGPPHACPLTEDGRPPRAAHPRSKGRAARAFGTRACARLGWTRESGGEKESSLEPALAFTRSAVRTHNTRARARAARERRTPRRN